MARRTTPSPEPDSDYYARAAELNISPEVAWYMHKRGIPLPECPPAIQTPSPGEAPGAVFDEQRVDRVLRSFELLRHTQGKWAGKPLKPDPWQVAYIIAPVFGWVRWDDDAGAYVRVVNTLYVEVPRKNGKSTLSGGIAVYLACGDNEPGAQVVTAATSRDQAGFVFSPIKTLAEKSPGLAPYVRATVKRIVHKPSGSYVEVVSSVADAQHGANLHGSVIDELHLHKTPDLVDAIETGTGSRTQPLIVMITTADAGKPNTIYARKRHRVEQLARRALSDHTTYGVIWAAAESEEALSKAKLSPFDERAWKLANPGYGISPTRAFLQRAATQAKDSPADLAKFLRLHLGIRTRQQTRYLNLAEWDRNAGMVSQRRIKGKLCYGGLDLGSTSDLTSLCLLFPDDRGGYDALWRFWAPEEQLDNLNKRTAGSASVWVREGWLKLTEGNVTDYEVVRKDAEADLKRYKIQELGYDPWNATDLTNRMTGDGAPLVEVRQGYGTLSPSLKEIKRLLMEGTETRPRIRHGGNPIMRWMIDNLAVTMDASGNVKPDKSNAADKIDGVSALATAMARAMHHQPPKKSIYETRGLTTIGG